MTKEQTGRPGRPRSDGSHEAILAATVSLLEENGFGHLTIERIAARAGVGKATIYRRWPNLTAVAVEAFLIGFTPRIAIEESDSPLADIRQHMLKLAETYRGSMGTHVREILGSSQSSPEALPAFVQGHLKPRREAAKQVLRRAIQKGEMRANLDLDAVLDTLYGPLFYRMLTGYAGIEDAFVEQVFYSVVDGLKPRAPDPG